MRRIMLPTLLAASVSGCSSTYRSIAVHNLGSGPIQDVNVRTLSGGFDVRYGRVAVNPHPESPGAVVFMNKMRIKQTDVCIVNWTDESSQKHEVQIDLRNQPQLGRSRGLRFDVHDDSVKVKSFKESE